MTNFRMTIRADCAVSARSPLPQTIKALATDGQWGGSDFGQESTLPQASSIQNKANFPFYQFCLILEQQAAGPHFVLHLGVCKEMPEKSKMNRLWLLP